VIGAIALKGGAVVAGSVLDTALGAGGHNARSPHPTPTRTTRVVGSQPSAGMSPRIRRPTTWPPGDSSA
jgi:hypothetical protein